MRQVRPCAGLLCTHTYVCTAHVFTVSASGILETLRTCRKHWHPPKTRHCMIEALLRPHIKNRWQPHRYLASSRLQRITLTTLECTCRVADTSLRHDKWVIGPLNTLYRIHVNCSQAATGAAAQQGNTYSSLSELLNVTSLVKLSYLHTLWDPLAALLLQTRTGPQRSQLPSGTSSFYPPLLKHPSDNGAGEEANANAAEHHYRYTPRGQR